jgi:hypothetical protein
MTADRAHAFIENVNETIIPCPKCRAPGVLFSKRSIGALIGSKHIAHVLHPATERNPSRRTCLLTRTELERIELASRWP